MSSIPRFRNSRMHMGDWITPAIRNLVLACTGVFLAQTVLELFASPSVTGLVNHLFGLSPWYMVHGLRVWQPVTYLFMHGGLFHLLFNMLFLWMFGVDLERAWGKHRFYVYFFVTGIGAALINVIIDMAADPQGIGTRVAGIPFDSTVPTIGASGAIYGILLAAAVMFPDRRIWLIPFPVQIPMKVYVIGAGAIEFFSTLGTGGDNVSHVTHLGGMLIGYLYLRRGSWFFRARNGMSDWKRKRARKKFEVYMRKHRDEPPSRPDNWVN